MNFFYGFLIALYFGWFIWYGGSGEPLTAKEVSYFKSQMMNSGELYSKDVTDPL